MSRTAALTKAEASVLLYILDTSLPTTSVNPHMQLVNGFDNSPAKKPMTFEYPAKLSITPV